MTVAMLRKGLAGAKPVRWVECERVVRDWRFLFLRRRTIRWREPLYRVTLSTSMLAGIGIKPAAPPENPSNVRGAP